MALSMSAKSNGTEIDLSRVRSNSDADGGIKHGRVLSEFVDAFMARDPKLLAAARDTLTKKIGADGMIDAAGVAANFQRMVRIADCIGIPIDERSVEISAATRDALGINAFHSAQNTFRPAS